MKASVYVTSTKLGTRYYVRPDGSADENRENAVRFESREAAEARVQRLNAVWQKHGWIWTVSNS